MSEKEDISVHILTYNSARILRTCLESVGFCKEILLIDGGSTDATLTIGKEFGATVISQGQSTKGPLRDFASARNEGLKRATQSWILALDSDESLSLELQNELKTIASTSASPAAYKVPRRYVLADGRVVTHATTYPNERLYFFHRDAVTQWERPVHERIRVRPGFPIRRLAGYTLAPLGSVEDYWQKNLRYLQMEQVHSVSWSWWFLHRLLRAIRGQITSLIKLAWIWLIPWPGTRLPLTHEFARWRYRWTLVWLSMPNHRSA